MRNLAITILRLAGHASIAAALRYHARPLERTHAPEAGRWREAHPFGELHVAQTPIGLQGGAQPHDALLGPSTERVAGVDHPIAMRDDELVVDRLVFGKDDSTVELLEHVG